MKIITHHGGRPIRAWVGSKPHLDIANPPNGELIAMSDAQPDIERSAMEQLVNVSKLPFIHPKGIAVMPDVHAGIGATVGSVIPTYKAIVPAAVGVDIGCGMMAVRTTLTASDLPDSLAGLRHAIERGIPTGMRHHGDLRKIEDNYLHLPDIPDRLTELWVHIAGANSTQGAAAQLCTLGGGNHFIEVCLDQENRVWVMLHSGSRGIGNRIGRYFIEKAKRQMERFFITLPDEDLAYLPEDTQDFIDYMQSVSWAQEFAMANRQLMMEEVLRNMERCIPKPFTIAEQAINCHHNYVAQEHHFGRSVYVTRKGAIRAREGDLGIIPGSMGAKSFIVRGKGNPESYCSCSHGAGRKMTRTEAERRFTVEDVIAQTKGVECAKDLSVVDEIPAAYKDIDEVMAQQSDLVEVVATLKQIMCIKGPKEDKRRKKAHA